jgi:transcription initiation factor TFIIH subunit 4
MERFVAYLESFDPVQLQTRLYAHVEVSLAVLRSLTPVERQCIMSLLLLGDARAGGVAIARTLASWTLDAAVADTVKRRLMKLGILELVNDDEHVCVSSAFAKCISDVVLGVGSSSRLTSSEQESNTVDPARVAVAKAHADVRWRALIGLLVNVVDDTTAPAAQSIVDLLLSSGLARTAGADAFKITHRGFQFLLDDQASQLWTLLLAHLSHAHTDDAARAESLSLLFRLARTPSGTVIDVRAQTAALSAEARVLLLSALDALGVVCAQSNDEAIVTPLAALLVRVDAIATGAGAALALGTVESAAAMFESSAPKTVDALTDARRPPPPPVATAASGSGPHIVVETNFKVYCYTTSALDVAVLSLFAAPAVRLPNLCVAALTRDSVRHALVAGITADQIVAYLRQRAHPALRREKAPSVPVAVAEQIALWAHERARVKCEPGALYTLPSRNVYTRALEYAKRSEVLLYARDAELQMIVDRTKNGPTVMANFFRSQ